MLVLSRKETQRILVGDDIVFEIVAIRRGLVRVGVTAPEGVSIHREEVYEAIQKQEAESVG